MISKKEIKHIAKLARLGLTERELEEIERELSKILDYIEKLKEIDIKEISATNYSFFCGYNNLKDRQTREDAVIKFDEEKNVKLVEQFPQTEERFLKVKSIL